MERWSLHVDILSSNTGHLAWSLQCLKHVWILTESNNRTPLSCLFNLHKLSVIKDNVQFTSFRFAKTSFRRLQPENVNIRKAQQNQNQVYYEMNCTLTNSEDRETTVGRTCSPGDVQCSNAGVRRLSSFTECQQRCAGLLGSGVAVPRVRRS